MKEDFNICTTRWGTLGQTHKPWCQSSQSKLQKIAARSFCLHCNSVLAISHSAFPNLIELSHVTYMSVECSLIALRHHTCLVEKSAAVSIQEGSTLTKWDFELILHAERYILLSSSALIPLHVRIQCPVALLSSALCSSLPSPFVPLH